MIKRKRRKRIKYKNEKLVGSFLVKNNIRFDKICIQANNRKYYPDYYISQINLIVEYNGAQHYKPVRFGNIPLEQAKENFEKQKIRDEQLRIFCNKNNIKLLEIDGRKYKGKLLSIFLANYFNNLILMIQNNLS